MTRAIVTILVFLVTLAARGEVTIRIFARTRPVTIVFTPYRGEYRLEDGRSDEIIVGQGETVVVTRFDNRVIYRTLTGASGVTDTLYFRPVSGDGLFTMRAPGRDETVKILDGSLQVSSFPGSLMVLNITLLESYLPGVVRAEAGKYGPDEYFRAQAVVARTYAYRNIDRHELDGFNMCDDTHCQVYPGIISDSVIIEACRATAGKVIVDRDSMLIVSAFHGNCGGMTASSADVWVADYPYLTSISDPRCGYSASSTWRKSLPMSEWYNFLRSKGVMPGEETALYSAPGNLPVRIGRITVAGRHITGEEMRQRLGLRSAYFSIKTDGDSLILNGRGYGHGVGMCQDGAKAMAAKKITYDKITGFYFPGTFITDIKNAHRPVRP